MFTKTFDQKCYPTSLRSRFEAKAEQKYLRCYNLKYFTKSKFKDFTTNKLDHSSAKTNIFTLYYIPLDALDLQYQQFPSKSVQRPFHSHFQSRVHLNQQRKILRQTFTFFLNDLLRFREASRIEESCSLCLFVCLLIYLYIIYN